MRQDLFSSIEVLEDRIAPAGLITSIHGNSIKYKDVDGDLVTVAFSKSFITAANVNSIFTLVAAGSGAQLESINLNHYATPKKLAGMSMAITAKKPVGGTGDGRVNVGLIDASGIALGNVKVVGDLGAIDAGTSLKNAVHALTLDSFGAEGLTTQALGGTLVSDIHGALPTLVVNGNVDGEQIDISSSATTILIKGSLDGSTQAVMGSGEILAGGSIKSVTIDGNLIGGSTQGTGEIKTLGGNISSLTIGGNLDGSLSGASGNSAYVASAGAISLVNIGGDVIGGAGKYSGAIRGGTGIGTVKIKGNLEGGTGTLAGTIVSENKLTSISIEKDVTAGASIRAAEQIGTISITGNITGTAAAPVVIAAQGILNTTAKTDVAISSLTVGKNMTYGEVLAGYDTSLVAQDPNAQIGAVSIGGNFTASDLVAGVQGTANGGTLQFGTASDAAITTGLVGQMNGIVSKIASITIAGTVAGDSVAGASYGITAQYLPSVKVGGTAQPLIAGASNDVFPSNEIALAPNLTIDEVPA